MVLVNVNCHKVSSVLSTLVAREKPGMQWLT